jgi:hypothetical protein
VRCTQCRDFQHQVDVCRTGAGWTVCAFTERSAP